MRLKYERSVPERKETQSFQLMLSDASCSKSSKFSNPQVCFNLKPEKDYGIMLEYRDGNLT